MDEQSGETGSRNPMSVSFSPEAPKWPFLRMRSENIAKMHHKCCKIVEI